MDNYDISKITNLLSILDKPRKYSRRVVFIRHGESEGNVRNIIYGSTDYALTQRGIYQAKVLSTAFQPILSKFQTIRSSNLTRSLQTCDIVVDLSNPQITTNFSVMGVGVLNNKWGILNKQDPIKTGNAYKLSNDFKRESPFENVSNEKVSEDMESKCFEKYKLPTKLNTNGTRYGYFRINFQVKLFLEWIIVYKNLAWASLRIVNMRKMLSEVKLLMLI
jgi:hypothetical protein